MGNRSKNWVPPSVLYRMYWTDYKSMDAIAKELHLPKTTVAHWFAINNIPVRDRVGRPVQSRFKTRWGKKTK